MKIGFIGLGAMGKPMAINVVSAGYDVTVFDINKDAVAELVQKGSKEAATPREVAADAEVVITMLPNFNIVKACLEGADGVLAGAKEGTIIVDMSSVAPGQSRENAKLAETQGVSYVDAPVSGGVAGAEKGALTIMVGGSEEDIEKVMPVLETMSKMIYRVGDVGSGDAVKLVNNLLLGINMAAVAEALIFGVKAGLSPDVLFDIISASSGNSYAMQAKVPKFILKGNFEAGFAIDLQYKDLELATQTGKELGVPMFMTNLAQQIFEQARAAGLGRKDISAVIQVLEKLVNVEVRG